MAVTMKQVAQKAGVSVSTVSIIVNAQQKQRHIPEETVDKVKAVIDQLGYHPNRIARQLRNADTKEKQIAICSPFDPNSGITYALPGLLSDLEREIDRKEPSWHLVLQSYKNDHIGSLIKLFKNGIFDAALIFASSEKDIKDLEKAKIRIPLILANRESAVLNTVAVSYKLIAQSAVTLLQANKIKTFSVVQDTNNYVASNQRISEIIKLAKLNGLRIHHIYQAHYDPKSGADIAKQISKEKRFYPLIVESDLTAIGMIYEFNRLKIAMPQQIRLLSLSVLSEKLTAFQTPALSTIYIPAKTVSQKCISQIEKIFKQPKLIEHISLPPELHLRETF